jgi:hypothetical protein
MKRILALALCGALTAGCSAQNSKVGIAYGLYKGCIAGTFSNLSPYPTTRKDTKVFVESLDKYCIDWTSAWLPAFIEDHENLSPAEGARFDNLRVSILNEVIETIVLANSKPMKP